MIWIIINIIAIACSIWLVAVDVKENRMVGAVLWAINCGFQIFLLVLNILQMKGI